MFRRQEKGATSPAEIPSENLLYGGKLPPRRKPETAEEPAVTEPGDPVRVAGGYEVTVRQLDDSFLAASGHSWIFRITTPEEKVIEGSARSRRKAERAVRRAIADQDACCRAERKKAEAREQLRSALTEAGLSEQDLWVFLREKNKTFLEEVTGGYCLVLSRNNDSWGRHNWEALVYKDQQVVMRKSLPAESGRDGGRRQARKKALEELRLVLLAKASEQETGPQGS